MNFFEELLDLVFVPRCLECGGKLDAERRACLCGSCWSKIRLIGPPSCVSCGKQLTSDLEPLCGACRSELRRFTDNRSAAVYDGVMRNAIHLFKYKDKRKLGRHFGEMSVRALLSSGGLTDIDCIIPVPIFRKKRRDFNQSEVLAGFIGEGFGLPVHSDVLVRTKDTRPQHELSRKERRQNVSGAFSLKNARKLDSRSVLLVDDIFTTGATANECSEAILSGSGAKLVRVFTLARGE